VTLPPDLALPLTVRQQTPVRVLHRRGNAVRERGVLALRVALRERGEKQSVLQVEMETEAGMYIKEWVHGDLGRTSPSLAALLGTPCTFLALDVYDVRLPGK
jgi:tRNA pseudouridine synthase 10